MSVFCANRDNGAATRSAMATTRMMTYLWTMCLIVIAHRASAKFPLVIAANRDELYARPTRPAHVWEDDRRVIGGPDLRAGGGWAAVRPPRPFAAITDLRRGGRGGGGP